MVCVDSVKFSHDIKYKFTFSKPGKVTVLCIKVCFIVKYQNQDKRVFYLIKAFFLSLFRLKFDFIKSKNISTLETAYVVKSINFVCQKVKIHKVNLCSLYFKHL